MEASSWLRPDADSSVPRLDDTTRIVKQQIVAIVRIMVRQLDNGQVGHFVDRDTTVILFRPEGCGSGERTHPQDVRRCDVGVICDHVSHFTKEVQIGIGTTAVGT